MYNRRIDIIICDQSDLVKLGLSNILRKSDTSNFILKLCHEPKEVNQYLKFKSLQILIANPDSIDEIDTNNYPLLKKVGLIYAYYNPKVLEGFDGIIHFNDRSKKILGLLDTLVKPTTEIIEEVIKEDILTQREKEILKLLVSGSSTKELSEKLFISIHTVNNHRKNIIKKLGISTISGLTIYAVINKIIDPKEIMKKMNN